MKQISLERISKLYRVIGREERSQDLTTRIGRSLLAPVRKLRELRSLDHFDGDAEPNVLWALRDVSFDVEQGEVIGIIGRNGAGKSTLLKILSRITRPTHGRATLRGRVSSLLEVGTGFHPELSGRENILLNGAIIGMRAQEIRRKMDAIIDYAGVEKFLETPIKRYSSGMKVRLAFAVAAHLEPDILVIDEVLAVGDTEFQQKCLGTMTDLGEKGRTVLFVSHNLGAVQSLCNRGIVLEGGTVRFDGPVEAAAESYLSGLRANIPSNSGAAREVNGFRLDHLALSNGQPSDGSSVTSGGPLSISLSISGAVSAQSVIVVLWISGSYGERLVLLSSRLAGIRIDAFREKLRCDIDVDTLMLMPGRYHLNVSLLTAATEPLASWPEAAVLEVLPDPSGLGVPLPSPSLRGVVYAPARWEVCRDAT